MLGIIFGDIVDRNSPSPVKSYAPAHYFIMLYSNRLN